MNDLDGIRVFLARDAKEAADRLIQQVTNAVDMLEAFPQIGRAVLDTTIPDVREILVQNYKITYRFEQDQVEVLIVNHGARRIDYRSLLN